ncbi:hypothetical protein LIER_17439 [Lithospermum erythrorhizon]|uniref:BSD domain-containing protein n=1 Tax=Lithospermum erythrorhizon TaxID=34254 RepID=A0AAV3QFR5_LITER
MDFFKSLVSDDPDPSRPGSEPDSPSNQNTVDQHDQIDESDEYSDAEDGGGGLWSFGGLIQSIATRSESVIELYRRDLQEFGSGLKKETEMFREAASKAVKDLPSSIDVAHGVIKSTAEIISHGKDSILSASDGEIETSIRRDSIRYNRFEAQLSVIQSDVRSFIEEPEDLEEFGRWKVGFALIDKGEEIEGLIGGDGVLEGMYKRVVPSEVDNETFWLRYFYRVHKLRQQESLRENLVRRAISIDDEEELSWDVDDDDEDEDDDGEEEDGDRENAGEGSHVKGKGDELDKKEKGNELDKKEKGDELDKKKDSSDEDANGIVKEGDRKDESVNVSGDDVAESKSNVESAVSKENVVELKSRDESEVKNDEKLVKSEEKPEVKKDEKVEKTEEKVEKSEEKVLLEGKGGQGGSGKETAVSVESSKQSTVEDEDLEWDEIEDVDSNDEKKPSASGEKSSQADLRKRLSTAEEDDEDLSWDIEDDDD